MSGGGMDEHTQERMEELEAEEKRRLKAALQDACGVIDKVLGKDMSYGARLELKALRERLNNVLWP